MTRRTGRRDSNHAAIVSQLRQIGCHVEPRLADMGHGAPDLLVSYSGKWMVMEVKSGNGFLTPDEAKWQAIAKAPVYVVRSIDDALLAIRMEVRR